MSSSSPSPDPQLTDREAATPAELVTFEQDDVVRAELAHPGPLAPPQTPRQFRRRVRLPIILFLLTCLSTFFAGATQYNPLDKVAEGIDERLYSTEVINLLPLRRVIYAHWENGLIYMACVLIILLTHEMGHFLMTLVYRVRASFPYFIPLPISPIGTMGAVIGMDGQKANRREIFDIGLAGPIAGLVVAIPILWMGLSRQDFSKPTAEPRLGMPLAMKLAIRYAHPDKPAAATEGLPLEHADPFFMAGWVGLLVTGLNMLPVSQLDGGHVTYALLGRGAHWLARGFMLLAFGYMTIAAIIYRTPPAWVLMAVLVLFLGTDHPPTSDDSVRLGWFRTALGYASLLIPIFCFVPNLQL